MDTPSRYRLIILSSRINS
ncbi:YsgD/CorL family protein [Escherichia coli]